MAKITILMPIVGLLIISTVTVCAGDQKCCEDLGCFDLGDPWNSILRPVPPPQCPDECPAVFYMFSRPNISDNYTISEWPIKSFNSTYFDGNKTMVLYTHGWYGSWDDDAEKLKDFYLQRADVNFIFLDWSSCSNDNYLQAVSTLRTIAAQAIRFIRYLSNNYGMSQCKMHILGMSLGAHVASYIAKDLVDNETNVRCVERLTGLEPAAPLFQGYSDEVQIASTDAKFVEIAHTETLPIVGLGEKKPRGDVDYYFNGNLEQPGCFQTAANEALQALKDGNFSALNLLGQFVGCGHLIVVDYYLEALKEDNCTFWGERKNTTVQLFNQLTGGLLAPKTTNLEECNITSCSPFGLKAIEYPARGNFFVATNYEEPYCIPEPQIDKMMAKMLQEYKEEFSSNTTTDSTS